MTAAGMMQVTAHEVIGVVAMRDGWVAAFRSMAVPGVVAGALMGRCTLGWIGAADRDGALVHVIAVRAMHVAIMQIIDVAVVLDGDVTAARLMGVIMARVCRMLAHSLPPPVDRTIRGIR
jgi:hypothetical protein